MSGTMQAIVLDAFGGPERFHLAEMPRPEPGPGEVRIRIRAIALNPVDWKMRRGLLPVELPAVLGRDVAGTVDAVGSGVTAFRGGEAVVAVLFGPRSNGAYAQYVATPAEFVAPAPRGVPQLQAATLGVAGLTAYEAVVKRARVRPGEAVFVAGGAGGVGCYAISLLRHLGASPILSTAGSDESAALLSGVLGLAPEHILRYREHAPAQQAAWVRERSGGRGVGAAFDLVGGAMKRLCFQVLDFYGRVTTVVEEYEPDFAIDIWRPGVSPLYARTASYHVVSVSAPARFGERRDWGVYREMFAALTGLVEAGSVTPAPVREMGPLGEETLRAAHALLETGHVQGKLVLTVP